MTRHVLRLITRLNIGGPARQALLLTRELAGDWPTTLAAGRPAPDEGEFRHPEVPVVQVPLCRPLRPHQDARALLAVRRLLHSSGARILHTHMAKAGTVGRIAAGLVTDGPRTIHTFHGHVLEGYFSGPVERAFVEIERRLARRTDVLLAVSPEIRDSLLALGVGRPGQIEVLPVGLDLSPYLALDRPSGSFRTEIGIGKTTPLIGAVGRLVPIKNHEMLLNVMQQLPEAHLAVIGDGELRHHLEGRSTQLGVHQRVHFVGWRHDLPSVLSDVDAVVLSSLNEGTPVSLIEALAAARPVVSTDVGGVRHVVQNEVTGLLAPSQDPSTFAERVRTVLCDPNAAHEMAQRGREYVGARFGERRLIEEVRALYESLAPHEGLAT